MSIIKILSEHLVNQIAAGEVVERPASVVKELVENSLDAGADSVSIEVKDGGKSFIKVFDNGLGMSREDLMMAVKRHATSKISNEADLWKIKTMGFRGEALASIASVAKMTIKSRRNGDLAGAQIDFDAGEVLTVSDVGMSVGTQIEVHNLFFNTPARQKYLKKESTELSHISGALQVVALANFDKAFKLVHNGKTVFDFHKTSDLLSRISDVFGKGTSEAMLAVFFGGSSFQIDGFIGKPLISRSTSQHQYFFVNGRAIQHHLLAYQIRQAYHSMLMENRKPVFIVNIKIDPALVDVNVHPRKLEVRFEDQESVMKAVYSSSKMALERANLIPKGFSEAGRYMSDRRPMGNSQSTELGRGDGEKHHNENFGKGTFRGNGFEASTQDALNFSKEILKEREHHDLENLEKKPILKAISQVANSYIVAENEEGLILIDQHAAHERVRYEQLMDQFENQEKSIQPLLVPQQMEMTQGEGIAITENMETFERLGFEIVPFGGNTFVVHAVPACLFKEDIHEVIQGVLDDVSQGKDASNMQGRVETILTYMSCRSAIKFGQKLRLDEMQSLIIQTESLKRPYTCPHGRPTMIALSLNELERMFGRK